MDTQSPNVTEEKNGAGFGQAGGGSEVAMSVPLMVMVVSPPSQKTVHPPALGVSEVVTGDTATFPQPRSSSLSGLLPTLIVHLPPEQLGL